MVERDSAARLGLAEHLVIVLCREDIPAGVDGILALLAYEGDIELGGGIVEGDGAEFGGPIDRDEDLAVSHEEGGAVGGDGMETDGGEAVGYLTAPPLVGDERQEGLVEGQFAAGGFAAVGLGVDDAGVEGIDIAYDAELGPTKQALRSVHSVWV